MQSSIRVRITVILTCLLLGSALLQGVLQSTQIGSQELIAGHWFTVGWSFLLVAGLAIWVAIWLAKDLTRPIEQMTQAAQKIAAGDLDQRVHIDRQDELGILAASFNSLADTNQRRYQEIVASRAQFETVIQNTVSCIFLLDAKGTVFLSNPAAGRVLGFDPSSDVPDHFGRLTSDPNMNQALHDAILRKQPYTQTVSIMVPASRVLELHVVPLATGDRFVAVFYDISEASRLASIRADLVANVSHELKTPVTSVHGFAETLLSDNLVSDPTGRRFVEIIYRESWRLLRLVNDLLDLSYLELDPKAIEKRPVDLVRILQDVVERDSQQAMDKQIDMKLVIGVQSAIAMGDDYRLSQAVDNLVGNAIKYTPQGGKVRVNLQYENSGFQIAVRDTGVGIEPEHLNRIFERFYRTDKARSRQNGGTGLGLSIVKHIVELHGGQVWVESKAGVGSVFYVYLPVQAGKSSQDA